MTGRLRSFSRRFAGPVLAGAFAFTFAGAGGGIYVRTVVDNIAAGLPPVPMVDTLPVSTLVVDRTGTLLRPFTTPDGRWRLPVTLDQVDRRLIDMLIAYEDKSFRAHEGIDWGAMGRAVGQFVQAGGRPVSGGSTLTMQVARLIEGAPTRALSAKLRQMVHAHALEDTLNKDEILTLYLTLAPYGGNIEGVRAASLAYFGKEPTRLTTAEAALLVALPQSPEARRPDRDSAAAREARDRVLDRMVTAGLLRREQADAAKTEPIPEARRRFPMLAAHAARRAVEAAPDARIVPLSIDARLQGALEALGAKRAAAIDPKVSVAILAADLKTGEIRASVGSPGLFADESDGHVDMTLALRSPGSTLKPLIYGLAFELGMAHPESLIEDRPTAFDAYVPVNFDGFSRGTVSIRQALAQSLNIPAIVVLDAVGTARLTARLRRANVEAVLPGHTAPGLAMGLGGVGVTLKDLVSLYAAFAREGRPVVLHDTVLPPEGDEGPPVLDPVAAYYVADILRDVAPPINGSPGRIAYKTGTSYGYRDAWAIGFDGETVVGVWAGRPDGSPVPGLTGIASAAPILFEAFDRLGTSNTRVKPAPDGAFLVANAELPAPLQRFRHPDAAIISADPPPEIAFPANGVAVDLGLGDGGGVPLMVKVRNGVPPFTYFANGAPFDQGGFGREQAWTPDGPGYVTLSVVDARGQADRVSVFLD